MPQTPGDPFDPGTDPGRPHPYESLYRAPAGAAAQPSRPTPRHFEPALAPPEGAGNSFGWLFREELARGRPADPPALSGRHSNQGATRGAGCSGAGEASPRAIDRDTRCSSSSPARPSC